MLFRVPLAQGERAERRRWRMKRGERVAAVEKIEDQRKPDDFFGYRNRRSRNHWFLAAFLW